MPYGRPFQNSSTIGDIVAGGVAGSVLFIGAGSALAQDNANFFWDNANNRLGIGNAAPAVELDVTGTGTFSGNVNAVNGVFSGFATVGDDAKGALQAVPARDLAGSISGLTYSNNAGDATNDLDIAAGVAIDSTAAYFLRLAAAITKQSDVAWAVGTNQGGLDTGAVGDNDYYIHLIARSDTGVVDVLFSLSATAPTMPANYDRQRLIGWFKRVAGAIVAFTTYEIEGGGIELLWATPTLDVDLTNTLTTTRRTDAIKVPLTFSVTAHINFTTTDAASAYRAWIYCPDQADSAPSFTLAPLSNLVAEVNGTVLSGQLYVRTSATGTIAARATLAVVDSYKIATIGFKWSRR